MPHRTDGSEIKKLVAALGAARVRDEEAAWLRLKPLGADVLAYFLTEYPTTKSWRGRVSMVFHALPYCRSDDRAAELGLAALEDRSRIVRYRACMLLACSLRSDAIPSLQRLLHHSDAVTVGDARAAIDAIEHKNHHYFVDRDHSGKVRLIFERSAA